MKKISCCINTYKRPELLKKLLISINEQSLDKDISIEIIVVDNDTSQLGEKIIEEFKSILKFPIHYYIQPIKNISITRNKAVSEAVGDYILFIDDDEYAEPNWISNTVACLEKYNADAVFGSVLSYFDDNTPDWIKSNQMFQRQIQKTGTTPKYTRTGNCLIKAEVLKSIEGPFDLQYGLTGGSDSHLFTILSKKGAKFIYCAESIVYEYVPPERANINWLLKRSIRTGNSYARRTLELSKSSLKLKIYLFFKAVFLGFIHISFCSFTFFIKKISSQHLIKAAGYWGHIMAIFNFYHMEYK